MITYYCIVFTDFQRMKLYCFDNSSLRFKIFLKFRKLQPRYSYKMYYYKKKKWYSQVGLRKKSCSGPIPFQNLS